MSQNKRQLTVSDILFGALKKRPRQDGTPIEQEIISEDNTITSADEIYDLSSSPLKMEPVKHIIPVTKNKNNQSVTSFLMQKKTINPEPVIISQDDEELHDPLHTLRNPKKLEDPPNFKKTKLKDLFNNFKKDDHAPSNTERDGTYNVNGPFTRFHEISKATQVETPLPLLQLIEPDEAAELQSKPDISLPRRIQCNSYDQSVSPEDFKSLNNYVRTSKLRTIKYITKKNKHTSLWTELFKPKRLNDVMLETDLKTSIKDWLVHAFDKLKKTTTRNQLLKSYKSTEMVDFIIDDEANEYEAVEEFVPILILHGEGIGKETLFETILNSIDGQIFEISASENRSKKDIMDKLAEYSTSHYVKDHFSNGIILMSHVDVIFKEHDKFFWQTVERTLLKSRRPIVLTCRDINYIPSNLIEICQNQASLFTAKKVTVKTVVNFLRRYCTSLGLELEDDILEEIVRDSDRDIRKCLMHLQFWFSSQDHLVLREPIYENNEVTSLREYSHLVDIMSYSDIINETSSRNSLVKQEIDTTLMTSESIEVLKQTTDDQLRLKKDYMIDYQYYLVDDVQRPILPFEINIGEYLQETLSHGFRYFQNLPPNESMQKYKKMTSSAVLYLMSRLKVNSYDNSQPRRITRNSRMLREILDRFGTRKRNEDIEDDIEDDMDVEFDLR
ncbi:hypothetical protein KAFR_0E02500 [Kazachstania africana CBS 2517]|uniref:ATPase AAA-type core domain-containing protein n=1 Tax=Kazachstania africana (strain ATCC 22294 / BCRC 22015 / CBS 2517 / CECT 1963 / NBRC 1671 / NRRL Y-8276) TaxID=1071382 RepID=H2AVK3_KAZAF|nr:hypothetical protein KAFR_0E02500 [Kazachstania africana CBS 2517]CCF58403.1 hypothetical protein KAFR_0E02500 [Kazachstania africana CBS 2517]